MFKLVRPCANCPFRIGQGELFRLQRERLREIFEGPAFQCHKTVDYDSGAVDQDGEDLPQAGDKPQQCAGLMSLLHRAGEPNQIMQIAERLGYWDPATLDHAEVYATIAAAIEAHTGKKKR